MIRLADVWLEGSPSPFLQLTFHSTTLLPGSTPFVLDSRDLDGFLESIDLVLAHLTASGCQFATLLEAADLVTNGQEPS